MAKARKKSPKKAAVLTAPRVPKPSEIGELCADIYRKGLKLVRQQGADDQMAEQLAMDGVRLFMAECIKQSKSDWKAYARSKVA